MAVGEHYQAWSEEVQEKIVSLFSHRLQSTAELRAKLEDANSLLSDWLKIGNNMAERRAIRDRARTFLASVEGRGGQCTTRKPCRKPPEPRAIKPAHLHQSLEPGRKPCQHGKTSVMPTG